MSRAPLPEPVPVDTVDFNDRARRTSAELGSDALLRRQIATGQHFLGPVALAALKQAKGW